MRGGCPVIATNIGGMREIVDSSTGILVDVDDSDALASRLNKLIGDKSLRAKLGGDGRRKYESEYTASKMAANLEAYYRTMKRNNDADDTR
jgi:glycosyltransferase involved in cell wall biosynthesis